MADIILHPATKDQADIFIVSRNLNSIGIYGQSGAGKSFFAKYLAERILDIKIDENSPYVQIIDCGNNVGIEEIRQIKSFLSLKVPSTNKYSRCVIIERIDNLGIPAQNALLKTLEEPPEGTILIATLSNKNSILPTIISRLQWINLLPLTRKQLSDGFFKEYEIQKLEKSYSLSEGYTGAMLKLMRNDDDTEGFLAAIDEAKMLLKISRFERLSKIDSIIKNDKYALDELFKAIIKILRSLASQNTDIKKSRSLIKKLELVAEAHESLKYKPSQKLLLTSLFNKL